MPGRLEGKVALVSGSTQGFGQGILQTFVREGAAVLGLDLQATDGLVDGYDEKEAYQIKADVTQEASWIKAVRATLFFFSSSSHPRRQHPESRKRFPVDDQALGERD